MSRVRKSLASHAALVPIGPGKAAQGFWDDGALLAMPVTDRDAEKAEEERRRERHSMAVAVCDKAIRDGCGGAGCTSPEHAAHVRQVLEDLRELGLVEDPLVNGGGTG